MGDDMTIYPTHTCFDDAIANLIRLMKQHGREQVRAGEILIVHAIIAPEGVDMAHAWLERGGKTVIFSGFYEGDEIMAEADRDEYYAGAKIQYVVKYTLFEAYDAEQRAGHYGPWDDRIREAVALQLGPHEENHKEEQKQNQTA